MAKLLLGAGANVNARRFNGDTPLHMEAGNPNVAVLALLLEAGADPKCTRYEALQPKEPVKMSTPIDRK